MATKFSDFTAQAATGTTFVVGYDGTTNTRYTQDQLTNFVLNGDLTANASVGLGTYNLGFTNGKVGVGLASPLYTFETRATVAGNWVARIMNESSTGYGLLVRANNPSSNITFATHNGNGYTTAFHGTGEVGIGTATSTPSAKLHVKGQGTTDATTSFLVENNNGDDILNLKDNRQVQIGTLTSDTETLIVNGSTRFKNQVTVDTSTSATAFRIQQGGAYTVTMGRTAGSTGFLNVNSNNFTRFTVVAGSGVAINPTGTASNVASAALTVTSTTKGMLPPRMNNTQRDAISSPATGLTLYSTTDNELQFYNGTSWNSAGGGASIYTADGSISENRTVTIANNGNVPYSVNFKGNSGAAGAGPVFLQIENERVDAAYSNNSGAQLRLRGGSSSGSLNTDLDIIAHGSNYGGSSAPQVHFNSNRGYTFTAGTGGSSLSSGVSQDLVLKAGSTGQIIASTTTNFGNNTNTTIAMLGGGGSSASMIQMGKSGNDFGKFLRGTANGTLQIGKHSGGVYGTAGTTTTEIYVDGSSNVGIGNNTTIGARLHVKGAGATNATTALLVEDSSGNDIIKALDDRTVRLGYNANQITTASSSGGTVKLNNVSGDPLFSASVVSGSTGKINVYGGYYRTFEYGASAGLVFTNQAGFHVAQDASSMLTCVSSTKGFLPPRMTTTQRDAINSGTFATGLTLYNTTDNKLQFYNGTDWTDAGGGGDNIYTADGTIANTNRTITTTGTSNITFNLSNNSRFYINSVYVLPTGKIYTPQQGAFTINSYSTRLQANYLLLYANTYITGTTSGFLTIGDSTGTSYSISARLGVVGRSTTSTSVYAFRVQQSDNTDMLTVREDGAIAIGKSAVSSTPNNVVIGGGATDTTSSNSFNVIIGKDANITGTGNQGCVVIGDGSLGTASGGVAVGSQAKAKGLNAIAIGQRAQPTGANSITLDASGTGLTTPSTANAFGVYMSNNTTPDFLIAHDGNSYITGTGNFGFGNANTSPTATVDIDGTFRLRSATNVNGKVLTADANGNGTWQTASSGGGYSPTISVENTNGGDVDLYDDNIVRLWLDDSTSDDIELEITNYASSTSSTYHVNYTNYEGGASSARTTTVDLNQSGATSISTLDFDFTDDECMKLRIWSPRLGLGAGGESSGFPFYEITIVKSGTLYTGSPVITSVLKSTS